MGSHAGRPVDDGAAAAVGRLHGEAERLVVPTLDDHHDLARLERAGEVGQAHQAVAVGPERQLALAHPLERAVDALLALVAQVRVAQRRDARLEHRAHRRRAQPVPLRVPRRRLLVRAAQRRRQLLLEAGVRRAQPLHRHRLVARHPHQQLLEAAAPLRPPGPTRVLEDREQLRVEARRRCPRLIEHLERAELVLPRRANRARRRRRHRLHFDLRVDQHDDIVRQRGHRGKLTLGEQAMRVQPHLIRQRHAVAALVAAALASALAAASRWLARSCTEEPPLAHARQPRSKIARDQPGAVGHHLRCGDVVDDQHTQPTLRLAAASQPEQRRRGVAQQRQVRLRGAAQIVYVAPPPPQPGLRAGEGQAEAPGQLGRARHRRIRRQQAARLLCAAPAQRSRAGGWRYLVQLALIPQLAPLRHKVGTAVMDLVPFLVAEEDETALSYDQALREHALLRTPRR